MSRHRKIKQTGRAQHARKVHVYGVSDSPPGDVTGIAVQQADGGAHIAWLPRGEVRKVRNALDKILGDK